MGAMANRYGFRRRLRDDKNHIYSDSSTKFTTRILQTKRSFAPFLFASWRLCVRSSWMFILVAGALWVAGVARISNLAV